MYFFMVLVLNSGRNMQAIRSFFRIVEEFLQGVIRHFSYTPPAPLPPHHEGLNDLLEAVGRTGYRHVKVVVVREVCEKHVSLEVSYFQHGKRITCTLPSQPAPETSAEAREAFRAHIKTIDDLIWQHRISSDFYDDRGIAFDPRE